MSRTHQSPFRMKLSAYSFLPLSTSDTFPAKKYIIDWVCAAVYNSSYFIFFSHLCKTIWALFFHNIFLFSCTFNEDTCVFNALYENLNVCLCYGLCNMSRSFSLFLPLSTCIFSCLLFILLYWYVNCGVFCFWHSIY